MLGQMNFYNKTEAKNFLEYVRNCIDKDATMEYNSCFTEDVWTVFIRDDVAYTLHKVRHDNARLGRDCNGTINLYFEDK